MSFEPLNLLHENILSIIFPWNARVRDRHPRVLVTTKFVKFAESDADAYFYFIYLLNTISYHKI